MRIIVHAPYGSVSQESGLLYVLANFIRGYSGEPLHSVAQLQCNGIFPLCDRDGERSWKRGVHSCLNCMADQSALLAWSGLERIELSRFLDPDEITLTRRWILKTPPEELFDLEYLGTKLYPLCADSFTYRFDVSRPDLKNRLHEQVLRRLLLATARMLFASRRFVQAVTPDLLLVAGGADFISRTLVEQAQAQRCNAVVFQWVPSQRAVQVQHQRNGRSILCELILQGVTEMRGDSRTWSRDLLLILENLLHFLDVPLAHEQAAVAQ